MRLCVAAGMLLIAGCAAAPWTETAGEYRNARDEYVVVLPQNWMRTTRTDFTLVTRDGVLLQHILIIRHKLGEPLPASKKSVTAQMSLEEIADVLFESFQADENVLDARVLEKSPARLSDISGLRVVFTYRNTDGLTLKSVAYGCVAKSWLYVVRYTAAKRYYFDRNLPAFNETVQTFRIL